MTTFITNLEAIPACEKEINAYYETATLRLNTLLKKYNIRNKKGKFEEIHSDLLKNLLNHSNFFQPTPLKNIFFNQKQSYVPQEIIYTFRSIISNPPCNVRIIFLNKFLTLLEEKGWDQALSNYLEKQYGLHTESTVILKDLKDFSLGSGVYKATFLLRNTQKEKISIFLKSASTIQTRNELLYFRLQKKLLPSARFVKLPHILVGKNKDEELLLSPLIPGISSDAFISSLLYSYRIIHSNKDKNILKKSLEILIESFLSHSALGDLLGRNDRHLMNSLIAPVVEDKPQTHTLAQLNKPGKILSYAKSIVAKKIESISLVSIDLAWLLGNKNLRWIFADIDFGLSEINLLSLLSEFNHIDSNLISSYKKRKEYLQYYFSIYCKKIEDIIENKETLFSEIKKSFPPKIWEEKSKILTNNLKLFDGNKKTPIQFFERYILNFRTRITYKKTLESLYKKSIEPDNKALLNALERGSLLKYLPPNILFSSENHSALLQLQCFRGILSKKDLELLGRENHETWEAVAAKITGIAKKFDRKLFENLENNQQTIRDDSIRLIKVLENQNIRQP